MKKTLLITALLISSFAGFAQKNTSLGYIEKFKDNAISIMHETGVPASIILGVAMHESGCGNSNIARKLNNQFGVKGDGSAVYYKNKKKVRTSYKKYDSILDSFNDFARIITQREQFSYLAQTVSQYDYESWVHGIQRGGYAGSKKWGAQVLAIIKKYQLYSLDETPADKQQLTETSQESPQ